MLSYNGDQQLKSAILREIRNHERADRIAHGTYGEVRDGKWRGCAIGCSLRSLNKIKGLDIERDTNIHERYPTELGIPIELAYLEDHVFENLPRDSSLTWPRRFARAVPVGKDLSRVVPRIMDRLITDPKIGFVALAKNDRERAAFQRFAEAGQRDWNGDTLSTSEWNAIDAELLAAGNVWARAGAWAWAGAWARAGAGARARARADFGTDYEKQIKVTADKLLELLASAPIVEK